MRPINALQVATFALMLAAILALAFGTTWAVAAWIPAGDLRGIVLVLLAVVLVYLYAFAVYRLFLRVCPLQEGELVPGGRAEFAAQVNILFYLLLFNTLIRSHVLPIPLLRLVYLALGAKLGRNTYSAGAILDPPLTEIGADSIVGHDAVIFSHAIEGERFSLRHVRMGSRVTIGAHAVVMSGVEIGEGAIVSAGSVVPKGTRIGAGEIWGGVPARRLR